MKLEKKIVLRCDGGVQIGWGHIMRCLHLSQWLKGKHKLYYVINQDAAISEFIKKKGFPVFEISERQDEAKYEEKVLNTILALEPHMVINDICNTTSTYMQTFKSKNIKMVNFDDTSNNAKMAQVVVDANRKEKEGKCFGPSFIVLSSLYAKLSKKVRTIRKKVRTIVVTLGGSDPNNLTEKTLRALEKKVPKHIEIQVILGSSYQFKQCLEKWTYVENIVFFENVNDVSVFLLNADIAVVGGGITMYESLCVGTPTVVLSQNKAQAKNARRMERKSTVINLGDGGKISEKKIIRKVTALIDSFDERKKLSSRAKQAIDGKGIFRVLEQIDLCL
ncbi:MAG: UDP-2,4-diacetamido-2,4,6-trideoxy-beta-L-altropyranose hydrolase [Candidatus Omnitrophica bacterium]|nr:UDP-2,4-diacetamido-2,4,6-trideoxy-beta-L-altropyranose hydrolase [Candidatus Omnitrophota bacterium]